MYVERVEKNKGAHQSSSLASGRGMTLGALFREGNVVQVMDAIFVDDSNTEGWQIQDEAFLELQRDREAISQQILTELSLWARL